MRKNQLIELLQQIEGNPEIHIWNGFVEDYMPISKDIIECLLVKESKEFIYSRLMMDYMQRQKAWEESIPEETKERFKERADEIFAKSKYDFPNQYVPFEECDQWYGKHRKKVYLLDANTRGKTTWDRSGTLSY